MTPTNIIERRIREVPNMHKNDAEEADPQHKASQNKTDKIYDLNYYDFFEYSAGWF